MSQLKPPSVPPQLQHKSHVNNTLSHCTHVFVRHEQVRKPLQPPYDGSFKVLTRDEKLFTLQLKDCIPLIVLSQHI